MDFKEQMQRTKDQKVEEYVSLRRDNPDQLILEIEAKFGFEHVK